MKMQNVTVNEFVQLHRVLRTWTAPGKDIQIHTWVGGDVADVKVFKPGSRVKVHVFWVGSDGYLPGYSEFLWGTVRSITAKNVMIDADDGSGRRMRIEDFSHMNWDTKEPTFN
jgi:hypothetical protein